MKTMVTGVMALLSATALAVSAPAGTTATVREKFMKQQALDEVQRVMNQVDMIESNHAALAERVAKIERGGGELANLKAEIDALRAELNSLRSELRNSRREIVTDLVKRIDDQKPVRTPAADLGPTGSYTVRKGDSLSLIATAFNTTVPRLKELNGLKGDGLREGQVLTVPDPKAGKRR